MESRIRYRARGQSVETFLLFCARRRCVIVVVVGGRGTSAPTLYRPVGPGRRRFSRLSARTKFSSSVTSVTPKWMFALSFRVDGRSLRSYLEAGQVPPTLGGGIGRIVTLVYYIVPEC